MSHRSGFHASMPVKGKLSRSEVKFDPTTPQSSLCVPSRAISVLTARCRMDDSPLNALIYALSAALVHICVQPVGLSLKASGLLPKVFAEES